MKSNRIVLLIAACCLIGCGRGNRPDVEYVEGMVLLEGEPVPGATVGFSPLPGEAGLPAVGRTDAHGVFRLSSTRGGKLGGGAVVGSYVVTVSKYEEQEALEQLDPEDAIRRPAKPIPPPQRLLPAIYEDPSSSPLRANVIDGSNSGEAFVFRLSRLGA